MNNHVDPEQYRMIRWQELRKSQRQNLLEEEAFYRPSYHQVQESQARISLVTLMDNYATKQAKMWSEFESARATRIRYEHQRDNASAIADSEAVVNRFISLHRKARSNHIHTGQIFDPFDIILAPPYRDSTALALITPKDTPIKPWPQAFEKMKDDERSWSPAVYESKPFNKTLREAGLMMLATLGVAGGLWWTTIKYDDWRTRRAAAERAAEAQAQYSHHLLEEKLAQDALLRIHLSSPEFQQKVVRPIQESFAHTIKQLPAYITITDPPIAPKYVSDCLAQKDPAATLSCIDDHLLNERIDVAVTCGPIYQQQSAACLTLANQVLHAFNIPSSDRRVKEVIHTVEKDLNIPPGRLPAIQTIREVIYEKLREQEKVIEK